MLWNELAAALDPTYKWLIMGDFNMVKKESDCLGGDGGPIRGREARAWTNLVRKCQLLDTFQARDGQLQFSWDNHHLHRHNPATSARPLAGARIMRWLDQITPPHGPGPSHAG